MKPYEPDRPLFSLHIPKCGGQSLRRLLEKWFNPAFRVHYFQQHNDLPPRHDLEGHCCIHGHFNHVKGFGVREYYPGASQFITVLRDPLEVALSNYFFWKTKERDRKLRLGTLHPGSPEDYRDVNDFFRRRPLSHIPDFLPGDMNRDNYTEYLESRFVWVGMVESLPRDIPVLADRLGLPRVDVPHLNRSARDETLSPRLEKDFRERNAWVFALVAQARKRADAEAGR